MGNKRQKPMSPEQIAALVGRSLRQGGIRAGQRVRPARELADMLDVSHATANRAMELLVKQRILVKRHGSGTFVRKLPVVSSAEPAKGKRDILSPHVLLIETPVDSRLQPSTKQQSLDIGLWTDVYWSSATHDLIVEGMQRQARELGHRIELHSLVSKSDTPPQPARTI